MQVNGPLGGVSLHVYEQYYFGNWISTNCEPESHGGAGHAHPAIPQLWPEGSPGLRPQIWGQKPAPYPETEVTIWLKQMCHCQVTSAQIRVPTNIYCQKVFVPIYIDFYAFLYKYRILVSMSSVYLFLICGCESGRQWQRIAVLHIHAQYLDSGALSIELSRTEGEEWSDHCEIKFCKLWSN